MKRFSCKKGIIERLEEEIAWCFDSSPDGVMVCLIENR